MWQSSSIVLSVTRFADPSLWVVHAGEVEQPVHGAQSLAVEQIIHHARYHPKGLDYDIALVKLSKPLIFNGMALVYALRGILYRVLESEKVRNCTLFLSH